eukprot:COSAG04_NODE_3989_length_2377_cov_1.189201_2_plen_254_part_00
MNSGVMISTVVQRRGQEGGRRRQQQVEVQWGDTKLQLSPAHYGKLRYMWEQRRRLAQRDSQEEEEQQQRQEEKEEEHEGQFAEDLFCLLLRYRTIRCSHFHAALPGSVFDWLREHFGAPERSQHQTALLFAETKGRPSPRQAKDERSFAKTRSGQTFKTHAENNIICVLPLLCVQACGLRAWQARSTHAGRRSAQRSVTRMAHLGRWAPSSPFALRKAIVFNTNLLLISFDPHNTCQMFKRHDLKNVLCGNTV